jgi:formiminoglutamase
VPGRPDDPRLGERIVTWRNNPADLVPGRAVLVGFPQDEGVRRNAGRVGAALGPDAIRHWLHRLVPPFGSEAECMAPLDLGNLIVDADLEASQVLLGRIVGSILCAGAVPIILGGGHDAAFGHYLGYVEAQIPVGIINIDAHLDVRPLIDGKGHSGSPFRQALEHAPAPLPGSHYVCLGAQPSSIAADHRRYVKERGGQLAWAEEVTIQLAAFFERASGALAQRGCQTYLTIDADVVSAAEVPGVSAPNPLGLSGTEVAICARKAGQTPAVASIDLVEINPRFDVDGRSARWAAAVVWYFLRGLAERA